MAVRSAFKMIFGDFPLIAYAWIGLGITASVATIISLIAPGWIPILIPRFAITSAEGVIAPTIWEGWIFIAIAVVAVILFWKSK